MKLDNLKSKILEYENENYGKLSKSYKHNIDNYSDKPLSITVTYYCRSTLILCCHGPK